MTTCIAGSIGFGPAFLNVLKHNKQGFIKIFFIITTYEVRKRLVEKNEQVETEDENKDKKV